MSRSSVTHTRLRSLKALLLGGVVLPMVAIAPVNAQDAVTDEVVVTGIQQSMKAATDVKRNSARIVDAVVAEDIGKLPDNNIAEALQRITGVSIASDFGVGDSVSIRGLSQNRVELNGRTTTGDGRDGISLQDFPSSFLRSVEVVKTPTADMVEGALGGTIRMQTVRPLDLDGPQIAGSFDYELADKTEEWAPIANVTGGNVYDLGDNGRIGFVGMFSTQDRTIRQDEFFNRVEMRSDDDDHDLDGLTSNGPTDEFAVRDQNTVQQFEEDRERTAVSLSLQWEPASQQGNVYFDYVMTDRTGLQSGSSILDVGSRIISDGSNATQDSFGQVNNYTLGSQFVIPKTWSDFRETESTSMAIGGEWDVADNITVSGEYAVVESESYRPDSEWNLRPQLKSAYTAWLNGDYVDGTGYGSGSNYNESGQRNNLSVDFSQSGQNIPSVTYSDSDALTDEQALAFREIKIDEYDTTNDETAYRLDVDFTDGFGIEYVEAVQVGLRGTSNEYKLNQHRYNEKNLHKTMVDGDNNPAALWLDDIAAEFPGSIVTVNHDNSFNQHGLSGDLDLLTYKVFDGRLLANPNTAFNMAQTLFEGTNFATTGSLVDNRSQQQGAYRDITEDTMAFYASADLNFGDITAVVGARFVDTEVESTVFSDHDNDGDTADQLVTGTHEYDDLLPSLNVSYDMAEDTKLRFAAAKVMRRPSYNNLSSAYEVDGNFRFGDRGALDLDPYRATQYDVSYEKYLDDGGIFSAAIYYKDVESFLKSTTLCEANALSRTEQNVSAGAEIDQICLLETAGVNRSSLVYQNDSQTDADIAALRNQGLTGVVMSVMTNGENGTVQGLEFGIQQQLDSVYPGLGFAANYTYADSEQPNGNPLLDISENTFNVQGYYEKDALQVRLAYNYRDEYLDTEEEKRVNQIGALGLGSTTNDETSADYDRSAGNNWRKARGQLDLSGSYDIQENLTFVASITNLLGEPSTWRHELGSNWKYTEADRRIAFGIRAKY